MKSLKAFGSKVGLLKRQRSATTNGDNGFPANRADSPACELRDPALDHMNSELRLLSEIFPDVPLDAIRHMVTTFSSESRLHLITDALLTRRPQYVSTAIRNDERSHTEGAVAKTQGKATTVESQLIRSEAYKAAVKKALYHEFSDLSRSLIRTVLADHNWSYTASRSVLTGKMPTVSGFMSLFSRRRQHETPGHPLLLNWTPEDDTNAMPQSDWHALPRDDSYAAPRGNSHTVPRLQPGVQKELADELQTMVIDPLLAEKREQQQMADQQLARQLNEQEAESAQALYECQCCFTPTLFEQSTACNTEQHFLCYQCLRHSLAEALYGQNWALSVDDTRGTLKCVALANERLCTGWIPYPQVRRALECDQDGTRLLEQFEDELSRRSLTTLDAQLLRCPRCTYTEVPVPVHEKLINRQHVAAVVFIYSSWAILYRTYCLGPSDWATWGTVAAIVLCTVAVTLMYFFEESLPKIVLIRREVEPMPLTTKGQKFICRNPNCSSISCLNCLALWKDPHLCFSDTAQSLRTEVEAAISAVVKRTCPICRLTFVKASGCNKMICRCGYSMCYLCKADLTKDKYSHFCNHFRPMGGGCTECQKCDLYREIDEQKLIREARQKAEQEWWMKQQEKSTSAGCTPQADVLARMKATVGDDGGLFK